MWRQDLHRGVERDRATTAALTGDADPPPWQSSYITQVIQGDHEKRIEQRTVRNCIMLGIESMAARAAKNCKERLVCERLASGFRRLCPNYIPEGMM